MRVVGLLLVCSALACAAPPATSSPAPGAPPGLAAAPLRHDAYVWQRAWTGAVVAAVADAPAEVAGLRVLASSWPRAVATRRGPRSTSPPWSRRGGR
ncbi:MAG: hypothetical protein H6708_21350 [Kofleriaceae bacterium]|nr:hypothetical protein [Kofleriaceae bacterium]